MVQPGSIIDVPVAGASKNNRAADEILVALVKVLARDAARGFLKQQDNQTQLDNHETRKDKTDERR